MKKYPIMIGRGLRKGIFAVKDPRRGWHVWIVWLNREIESGETFKTEDIDNIDAQLYFCDKESVEQFMKILKCMINTEDEE